MTTTVYGLTYCEDDGSREAWTWHYMPIELFATDALREKRMAALRAENGEYEFDTFDTVVVTEDAEAVAPDASKEEDERKITDFFADLLAGN